MASNRLCPDPEPPSAQPSDAALDLRKASLHPRCFVCGQAHPCGLHMDFHVTDAGTVTGVFRCAASWEGFAGRLHGGIVSALLDGAMSSCLMARGIEAVTADIQVRFLRPVLVGEDARVEATWREQRGPIHDLDAVLFQGWQLKARAKARFFDTHEPSWL